MSSTKYWSFASGAATRTNADGTHGQGCGGSKRLYVGLSDASSENHYVSYGKPTPDWVGVGKIVSATLIVYTDDFAGLMQQPTAADTPKIVIRTLTSAFAQGNNVDGAFDASDYTKPGSTTSGQVIASMSKVPGGVNRIDVTAWAEAIAPATVRRRNGSPGGKATNYGLQFWPFNWGQYTNWSGWSDKATDPSLRPQIELVYELGPTVPDVPTNLAPVGAVANIGAFEADFSDQRASDRLKYSEVEVYTNGVDGTASSVNDWLGPSGTLQNGDIIYLTSLTGGTPLTTFTPYYVRDRTATTFRLASTKGGAAIDITVTGTALTYAQRVYAQRQAESDSASQAGRSSLTPSNLLLVAGTTYKWRVRHTDQEGQVSPWAALVAFSVSNTNPNPPTLTPASGAVFDALDAVLFRGGTFSDADGDGLLAYQVQLAQLDPDDPLFDDPSFLLWDTGKSYVRYDETSWWLPYGGRDLAAGAYTWRARQWDTRDGVSDWAYATFTLTADFDVDPGNQSIIQVNPQARWRIVIKGMTTDGKRGPGATLAILENAKSVGASIMYNSPGELHFTLPVDHPQISVIEPRQTHYSLQFYQGSGWQEVFAGLIWDFDATETSVVFFGIDYLGLLDLVLDERYDPAAPDKTYDKGGSKYVNKTIREVIVDQLTRATTLANSPVGFITLGRIATMDEKVTIWSTMEQTLNFVSGLIDSHRQGAGKKTRIRVLRNTGGTYQFVIDDDPGIQRDALRLNYGELVQGYRIIPFGDAWASLQHAIGRTRDGLKVMYKTEAAPGIDQAVWGRIARVMTLDGVTDENDLIRRLKQAAIVAGKIGKRVALGIRTGFLLPLNGYNICDSIPVAIDHGAVRTANYGSGYWTIYGVAWEAGDDGSTNSTLSILPREDTTAPNPDLIPSRPISPQGEWQVGWTPPDPLTATSKYWLDQSTGIPYVRDESGDSVVYTVLGAPPVLSKRNPPTLTSGVVSRVVKMKVAL